MPKQLSEEQIINNQKIVEKLIETFKPERAEKVKKMMEVIGQEYYTAPASARSEYHNCFVGGLADHSLRVIKNLKDLVNIWAPNRFSAETLIFTGLFHDLGKVGDGVEPYYIMKDSDWHRKQGILYETNKNCVYMPTSERGLYLLQKFGVTVNADEYLAIRLNDGMYDETNKRYAMKEPDLAVLVHMADRWSCSLEKRDA